MTARIKEGRRSTDLADNLDPIPQTHIFYRLIINHCHFFSNINIPPTLPIKNDLSKISLTLSLTPITNIISEPRRAFSDCSFISFILNFLTYSNSTTQQAELNKP